MNDDEKCFSLCSGIKLHHCSSVSQTAALLSLRHLLWIVLLVYYFNILKAGGGRTHQIKSLSDASAAVCVRNFLSDGCLWTKSREKVLKY